MSQVLWCDIAQHPFPRGQRGSTTLKVEEYVKNQWGGAQPHEEVRDVCAACAKDQGLRQLKQTRSQADVDEEAYRIRKGTQPKPPEPKAVEAPKGKHVVDDETYQDYIKYLEKQNDIG